MNKIENLTPEQEVLLQSYINKYHDKICNLQSIDKIKTNNYIKLLYEEARFKEPKIVYAKSPLDAQIIANQNLDKVNIHNNFRHTIPQSTHRIGNYIDSDLHNKIFYTIGDNLSITVFALERIILDDLLQSIYEYNKNNSLIFIPFSEDHFLGCFWKCMFDFIINELLLDDTIRLSIKWKAFLEHNIYEMILLDGLCIVVPMPTKINLDNDKKIHSEYDAAIKWGDDYYIYAWHGTRIPKEYILNKESITKETFINEKNAERRRCLKEILGNEALIKLLDVELIDEDIEETTHSNLSSKIKLPIKLYKTKEKDELIDDYIYFLNVVDPSTMREYYLCVPEAKNVWEAKGWTFNNQKIEIRHGDVGLLNLRKEFDKPIFES